MAHSPLPPQLELSSGVVVTMSTSRVGESSWGASAEASGEKRTRRRRQSCTSPSSHQVSPIDEHGGELLLEVVAAVAFVEGGGSLRHERVHSSPEPCWKETSGRAQMLLRSRRHVTARATVHAAMHVQRDGHVALGSQGRPSA